MFYEQEGGAKQQPTTLYPKHLLRRHSPSKGKRANFPLKDKFSLESIKKRLLQKSEGNFSEQSPGWILRGIFWWIFRAFFLWKNRRKNPRQNSNRNLGVSRAKSTLPGSCLEKVAFPFRSECPLFPTNRRAFERKEFLWLEGKFMAFCRKGKIPLKPFFCLVAPCGWEFNRGRGRGWESWPLSRFCFAHVLKGF